MRYIDADALRKRLCTIIENAEAKGLYNIAFNYEHCLKMIDDTPTADVVPIPDVDETLEDLLVEFDEFGMQPTILVPDPEGMAIEWKRKLEYAIGRIKADTARKIFEEINAIKKEYASGDIDGNELYIRLYQLEKKYLEGEK